jgi:hypothetical protein
MCEEESDDHEAVAKLFEINDSIHRTIERYRLIKKGDLEGAAKIPKGTLGTSGAGVSKGPDNELSLIDFGGPEDTPDQQTASSSTQHAPTGNHLDDDLLGLSIGGDYSGQTGGISLGSSNSAGAFNLQFVNPLSVLMIPGLSGFASGVSSPPPPQSQPSQSTIPQPNYNPFGSIASSQPPPPPMSPPFFSQPQIIQPQQPPPRHSAADPFASLSSPAPRQGSPFQFQQSIKPSATPSATPNDLLGLGASSATVTQHTTAAPPPANDDDEWTFTSAVPDLSKDIVVSNTHVNVTFNVVRESDSVILIKSRISNNTIHPVTDLTFQVAVSKVCSENLLPCHDKSIPVY